MAWLFTRTGILAFTPDGTKLYVANYGGMYSTTDALNPTLSFAELNDTLALTQFYPGLSIHPDNPGDCVRRSAG